MSVERTTPKPTPATREGDSMSAAITIIDINNPAPLTGDALALALTNPWLDAGAVHADSTPSEILDAFEGAAERALAQDFLTSVETAWSLRGLGLRLAGLPLSVAHEELYWGEYASDVISGWLRGARCERCGSDDTLRVVWPCSLPEEWGAQVYDALLEDRTEDVACLLSRRPRGGRVLCECEWCMCDEPKSSNQPECSACTQATAEAEAEGELAMSPEWADDWRDHDEGHTVGPDYWRNEDGEYRCG
jgi:hypothetical protein